MGIKQKLLVGTLVGGTACVLVGSLIVFPPMIIIGGVAVGLSLRKRLLFKKKKKQQKPQKKSKFKNIFKRKQQDNVIRLEQGQQLKGEIEEEPLRILDW